MLQHIDEQKLEEILTGISGLHGPDAREILKHNMRYNGNTQQYMFT